MSVLTEEVIASFKDAARKLTGPKRRAFQAQVTLDYLDGSIWKAERVFGWSHHTVALGLNELRTGITCLGNFSARGNHKTEEKLPELEADIRALADPESQADPKFQSPFLYTRITAKAMRQALIDQKGWTDEELPHVNTIGEILNRLGYKMRRVQKTKPLKKIPETDAIFENVRAGESGGRRFPRCRADFHGRQGQSGCGGLLPGRGVPRGRGSPGLGIMTPRPRRNWSRSGS